MIQNYLSDRCLFGDSSLVTYEQSFCDNPVVVCKLDVMHCFSVTQYIVALILHLFGGGRDHWESAWWASEFDC